MIFNDNIKKFNPVFIKTSKSNLHLLLRLLSIILLISFIYSYFFRLLMIHEGRQFDWITALYWTLTNMFTLGLGDIVFTGAAGKLFNIVVLLTGLIFIFIAVPYTIIQLFQSSARIHRELPKFMKGHVILTSLDPLTEALIHKLDQFEITNFLIIPEHDKAIQLLDRGFNVVLGNLDDTLLYKKIRAAKAAGIASSGDDIINTAVAYAVRQEALNTPIVSTISGKSTELILSKIGVNAAINVADMLGQALSRRITAGDAQAHTIGEFNSLQVAEAAVVKSAFSGKTLREVALKEMTGVNVIGVLEHGKFFMAGPNTKISDRSTLLLCGSEADINNYNMIFSIYNVAINPVLVIGFGKVGQELCRILHQKSIDYVVLDKKEITPGAMPVYIGDATEPEILNKAGLMTTPAVVITTLNDTTNIYITSLIRSLRPEVQIITSCVLERNADLLYRAGADSVISYSTLGANYIFNALFRSNILMIEEDVYVMKVNMPSQLANKTLASSGIREMSGCNVISIEKHNNMLINPAADTLLECEDKLIIICNEKSEKLFFEHFDAKLAQ